MGRAIVREPQVFLMDEPLSNLDAKLRVQTRSQIAELQRRLGITTVYVTHDQVEAMTMGHRVAVLAGGQLQQCDTPRQLYDNPVNQFVAGFIGSPAMNLQTVPLTEGGARLAGTVIPLPTAVRTAASQAGLREIVLGIRPEHLHLANGPGQAGRRGDAGGRARRRRPAARAAGRGPHPGGSADRGAQAAGAGTAGHLPRAAG